MPLKLVPPRLGKSPNWSIRGTYLRVPVDRSTGTPRKAAAQRQLELLRDAIERGDYPPRRPEPAAPTFLSAAIAYMRAGRRRRYVARLIEHFGETPLAEINQTSVDAAALALHPNVTPATRVTCVYIPIAAILHHALGDAAPLIKRPKGGRGRTVTDFLTPDDAFAIIGGAETFDPELALLLTFLLYTGVRLGEALRLTWPEVDLEAGTAWIRTSKNGDPRALRLRADLCEKLALRRGSDGRLFRFRQGGHMKHLLLRAKLKALGIDCPVRRPRRWRPPPYRLAWANYHTFRHTFATWFRRYGGGDVQGLVATGNWRDARSAARYSHAVAREEWRRVDDLPDAETFAGRGKSVESA